MNEVHSILHVRQAIILAPNTDNSTISARAVPLAQRSEYEL